MTAPGRAKPRGVPVGVFEALDQALVSLLEVEGGEDFDGVTIDCAGADEDYPPSGVDPPAIMLFLYDVRENAALRTSDVDRSAVDGTIPAAPVRVDCSYLVTAWPRSGAREREHQLLGQVLAILLRHRQLPTRYLRGVLAGQEPPARLLGGHQLQSVGEFWQAMGGRPKATLHYGVTVTVPVDDPPVPPAPNPSTHVVHASPDPAAVRAAYPAR